MQSSFGYGSTRKETKCAPFRSPLLMARDHLNGLGLLNIRASPLHLSDLFTLKNISLESFAKLQFLHKSSSNWNHHLNKRMHTIKLSIKFCQLGILGSSFTLVTKWELKMKIVRAGRKNRGPNLFSHLNWSSSQEFHPEFWICFTCLLTCAHILR